MRSNVCRIGAAARMTLVKNSSKPPFIISDIFRLIKLFFQTKQKKVLFIIDQLPLRHFLFKKLETKHCDLIAGHRSWKPKLDTFLYKKISIELHCANFNQSDQLKTSRDIWEPIKMLGFRQSVETPRQKVL